MAGNLVGLKATCWKPLDDNSPGHQKQISIVTIGAVDSLERPLFSSDYPTLAGSVIWKWQTILGNGIKTAWEPGRCSGLRKHVGVICRMVMGGVEESDGDTPTHLSS